MAAIDRDQLRVASQALDQGAQQARAFAEARAAMDLLLNYDQVERELLARVDEARASVELAEAEALAAREEADRLVGANLTTMETFQAGLAAREAAALKRASLITTEADTEVAVAQTLRLEAENAAGAAKAELVRTEKRLAELAPVLERAERAAAALGQP